MKVEIEFNEHRVLMLALGGAVGLFALHAAYPGLYGYWPQSSQDLAAWVQAVGSVAAIVGAVWATKYQIRRAKEVAHLAERQKALQFTLASLHVSERAHRLARSAMSGFVEWNRYNTFMGNLGTKLQSAVASADIVLTKELDAELLQTMLDVRMLLTIASGALDLRRDKDATDGHAVAMIDMSRAKNGLANARWQIRRRARELAAEVQALRES